MYQNDTKNAILPYCILKNNEVIYIYKEKHIKMKRFKEMSQ